MGLDTDNADFTLLRGNKILLIRCSGIPLPYTNGTTVSTVQSPYQCNLIQKEYLSYYDMGDSKADTYVENYLPFGVITSNGASYAVNYIKNNNSDQYATPIQTHSV